MEAAHFVSSVLGAALISLSVTTIATGLLVIPGVWLYTRWSLATPVIRTEGVGPLAAKRRSNDFVRGRFWFVFITATVPYYLEGVVIHESALVAGAVTGSYTWGGMGGRFDRGDAGHAPGGLRYLVGPLQRGESDVTRCNRQYDDPVVFLDRFFHQPAVVDIGWHVCDSCRLSIPGIGIVKAGK